MTCRMLTTLAIAAWSAGLAGSQPPEAAERDAAFSSQTILVGCLAKADEGFLLKTASAVPSGRRTGGSTSAKGSTPLNGGQSALTMRKESGGSNSAKASTPIGPARPASDHRRTGGVTTPKGSIPVGAGAASEMTYSLQADAIQLASYADQMVEIRGTRVIGAESAATPIVKIDSVRGLSSPCAQ